MFCVTVSICVIKKKEGSPLRGHSSHSQPQSIYHEQFLKAYCLITPATTPIYHSNFLYNVVWFTPMVPTSCAQQHSNKEQALPRKYRDKLLEPRNRLMNLKELILTKELLPGEQCGFHRHRSTTDRMFAVCRLRELGRKAHVP